MRSELLIYNGFFRQRRHRRLPADSAADHTFPPGLSNHDRAVVHAECKKYGFVSKSSGHGDSRAVTVSKRRAKPQHDPVFELPLGAASLDALAAYFARHPPTEAELAQAAGEGHGVALGAAYGSGAAGSSEDEDEAGDEGGSAPAGGGRKGGKRRGDRGPHAAEFDAAAVAKRRERWEQRIGRPDMQPLIAARAALPIAAHREEIIAAMQRQQVIMIAGETGCGKTTQVCLSVCLPAWLANPTATRLERWPSCMHGGDTSAP